ncbi:MAG: Cof-type HAD-IIB family hydrolase [Lachnospirales bacterium]
MYKLVVLDIDGTLINSERKITEETKKYIKIANEKGVKFMIASGRTPYGVLPIAKEIELEKMGGYILAFNGGCCINCEDMTTLYEEKINKEEIVEIYNFAKEKNVPMVTYNKDTLYTPNESTNYIELEARLNNLKLHKTENFLEEVNFDFPKVLYLEEGEILEKIEKETKEKFSNLTVFRSEPFFLEICPNNIHKATGIAKVLDILKIDVKDVIAIGDGYNDLTMIEFAGLGVAMGNAKDELKKIANYVTGTNDEDGIVQVIKKFILEV